MKLRSTLLWILALILTVVIAHYQRATGPTYPLDGRAALGPVTFDWELTRTHGGAGDQPVRLVVPDTLVSGVLYWKHYKLEEPLHTVPMRREGDTLSAALPHQPPAGKLEYQVKLTRGTETLFLPAEGTVVTRFKGHVPLGVLIPHILFMFAAMLLALRAA
ncbi:MAG TPA: hypothetical protein ENI92_08345, partial [Bacteroidetes bacterium]|nr:hypothetical protein [Bacteroidota bacterium]